jgi:hypothetical protein
VLVLLGLGQGLHVAYGAAGIGLHLLEFRGTGLDAQAHGHHAPSLTLILLVTFGNNSDGPLGDPGKGRGHIGISQTEVVPFTGLPDLFFRDVVLLAELAEKSVRVGCRLPVDLPQKGIELPVPGRRPLGEGHTVDEKAQEDEACRCGQKFFHFDSPFNSWLLAPQAPLFQKADRAQEKPLLALPVSCQNRP